MQLGGNSRFCMLKSLNAAALWTNISLSFDFHFPVCAWAKFGWDRARNFSLADYTESNNSCMIQDQCGGAQFTGSITRSWTCAYNFLISLWTLLYDALKIKSRVSFFETTQKKLSKISCFAVPFSLRYIEILCLELIASRPRVSSYVED